MIKLSDTTLIDLLSLLFVGPRFPLCLLITFLIRDPLILSDPSSYHFILLSNRYSLHLGQFTRTCCPKE
jgi:hypothetical protein